MMPRPRKPILIGVGITDLIAGLIWVPSSNWVPEAADRAGPPGAPGAPMSPLMGVKSLSDIYK